MKLSELILFVVAGTIGVFIHIATFSGMRFYWRIDKHLALTGPALLLGIDLLLLAYYLHTRGL